VIALLLALQTVTVLFLDVSVLGPDATVYSAELDGYQVTEEYVIDHTGTDPAHPHYWMIRTAKKVAGGYCLGPWHDPRDPRLQGLPEAKALAFREVRGRTVLEATAFVPSLGKRVTWQGHPQAPTTCVAP